MDNIDKLIESISKIWQDTRKPLRPNIQRGHTRSISTDIEDAIAIFIVNTLDSDCEIFIDPSVRTNEKTNRPDLLIISDNKVKALIEIKANMGWCRDAKNVIDKETRMHKSFTREGKIVCKFSATHSEESVVYSKDVRVFLIAFTSRNGGKEEKIKKNIEYARSKNITHYLLFDGWYNELKRRDIEAFETDLLNL